MKERQPLKNFTWSILEYFVPSIHLSGLYVEINVRKKKWVIGCLYNSRKAFISAHLRGMGKKLNIYSSSYDKCILLGELNSEPK